MYAPHTVTVFNVGEEEDIASGFQPISATILRGVMLDASKAVNVRESGLVGADSVNLYIPFTVEAVDALTGLQRSYVGPKEYDNADDVSGLWTLGTGERHFFAKGEITEALDFQTINRKYESVHQITKVDTKDFGSPSMRHWEVGGV